jgi:acyl carrier protein
LRRERPEGLVDTHSTIRQFIETDLARDLSTVANSDSLLEAGIIDSMAVLQIVGFIEQRFGVTVADDDMMPENFETVDAMAAFVDRSRKGQGV